MLRYRIVRVIILFFVVYFVFLSGYHVFVVRVSHQNYQHAFDEFEACFPMQVVEKSFKRFSSPPWFMSNDQMKNKEMFLELLQHDALFAIYRENDYWSGEFIYYGAISPTDYSTFISVFRYKPKVIEIDHGWLKPKTYEIT